MMLTKIKGLLFVALLALVGQTGLARAQMTPAGSVIFANGDVRIVSASGTTRNAVKGMSVTLGDTLITGNAGALHVRMADSGFVALRADTQLTVRDFVWNGKEDGREKSVLSLVRGGFRTITGIIGRRDKDNYQVVTPTATIGIRGTDHEPHFIPPGSTQQGEPGAYDKVNVGATYIRNAHGVIELGPNQVGFAPVAPGVAPMRLTRLPGFMRNAPIPLNLPQRDDAVDDTQSRRQGFLARLSDWAEGNDDRKRFLVALLRYASIAQGSRLDIGTPVAEAFSVARPGYAMVGGLTSANTPLNVAAGGLVVTSGNDKLVLLGPGDRPLFIGVPGDDGFRYSRGRAPLADSGSAVVNSSNVNWGIYEGGDAFLADRAFSPRYFHFMGTGNVTSLTDLVLPGTTAYGTVAGFTKPIIENGQVGGTVNLNLTINFGAIPMLTSYNLTVVDALARNWNATLNSPITLLNFAPGGGGGNNLVVNCATCSVSGAGNGKSVGYVIGGANRDGVISSYALNVGPASVTGAVAVKPAVAPPPPVVGPPVAGS